MKRCAQFALAVVAVAVAPAADAAPAGAAGVPAPGGLRVPATAPLPPGRWLAGAHYRLEPPGTDWATIAQACSLGPWAQDGPYLAFTLPAGEDLPTDAAWRFSQLGMRRSRSSWPFPFLTLQEAEEKHLHISEGDQPALTYNFGMMLPEGVPADRRRACYIHPLYGLDGEQISGDFERDHYHHRGVFWAWPRMEVGGRAFSLWDLRVAQQRFEKWLGREAGPVCAVFGVQNGWYMGGDRIAGETLWVRVWRAGDLGRAIDVHLTFAATDRPIEILGQTGKGYGGFNLRFGPREDTVLTSPEGRERDGNLKPLPWADLSARFAGADDVSGAAVFVDSRNPGFPNGWTLRHYGFLGVAWPGLEPYTLEPAKPLTVRYRLWVHRGDAEAGRVAEAYSVFAQPPTVTLSTDEQD